MNSNKVIRKLAYYVLETDGEKYLIRNLQYNVVERELKCLSSALLDIYARERTYKEVYADPENYMENALKPYSYGQSKKSLGTDASDMYIIPGEKPLDKGDLN